MDFDDDTLDEKDPTAAVRVEPRLYRRRWAILLLFCALSTSNAFQWMEYAIINDIVQDFYGVESLWVDWTSIVYMAAYIPLIWPAVWALDKYGLRVVTIMGALGNAVGSWIKCGSAHPSRWVVTFLGQAIVGSSQIFILNLPPRLAAVWFGPKEVSTACAIGVFGNQLGIALGFLIPPMLVQRENGTHANESSSVQAGFQHLFIVSAVFNTVILVLVAVFFKSHPPVAPSPAQLAAIEATKDKHFLRSLKKLLTNVNFILLFLTYGINVGAFYAISTLLNQMLLTYYTAPGVHVQIGFIGLLIVLAGMVGSVVAGLWLDKTHTFKYTCLGVYIFSFAGMVVYTCTINLGHLWLVFVVAGLLGFFMTGYLPLGFEFGAEVTYPVAEGTVSGLLNMSCQIFGTIETYGLGFLLMQTGNVLACNIIVCVLLFAGVIMTAFIKNDLRRQRAHHGELIDDNGKLPACATTDTLVANEERTTGY